jgi:hypothetical protein
MTEATQEEIRVHADTYASFNKMVLFCAVWVILLLASMALGLIAHIGILSLLIGVGGTVVLLIAFAVLG